MWTHFYRIALRAEPNFYFFLLLFLFACFCFVLFVCFYDKKREFSRFALLNFLKNQNQTKPNQTKNKQKTNKTKDKNKKTTVIDPRTYTGTDKDHDKPSVLGISASLVMGVKVLYMQRILHENIQSL